MSVGSVLRGTVLVPARKGQALCLLASRLSVLWMTHAPRKLKICILTFSWNGPLLSNRALSYLHPFSFQHTLIFFLPPQLKYNFSQLLCKACSGYVRSMQFDLSLAETLSAPFAHETSRGGKRLLSGHRSWATGNVRQCCWEEGHIFLTNQVPFEDLTWQQRSWISLWLTLSYSYVVHFKVNLSVVLCIIVLHVFDSTSGWRLEHVFN